MASRLRALGSIRCSKEAGTWPARAFARSSISFASGVSDGFKALGLFQRTGWLRRLKDRQLDQCKSTANESENGQKLRHDEDMMMIKFNQRKGGH